MSSNDAPVHEKGEVGFGLGLTLNAGNYQSIRLDVSLKSSFDEGVSGNERGVVYEKLVKEVTDLLYKEVRRQARVFMDSGFNKKK